VIGDQLSVVSCQSVFGKLFLLPSSPSPFSLQREKGSKTQGFPSPR